MCLFTFLFGRIIALFFHPAIITLVCRHITIQYNFPFFSFRVEVEEILPLGNI